MKIIFVSGTSPEFLGGISLYQINLINGLSKKNKEYEFTWIYPGNENKEYYLDKIRCLELKSPRTAFLKEYYFGKKVKKYLDKENFDIINTHANWGYCLKNYKQKKAQKIIHTYHGVTYYYFKSHLPRFNFFFRICLSPALLFSYFIEKPPIKKADKIICVSNRVKREIEKLYGKRKGVFVIRTGVDLKKFKPVNRFFSRKVLGLEKDKLYGLFVGRGGYWRKGLDRAVKISEEIYNLNKNFRLIVIGPDKDKVKSLVNKNFINYIERVNRDVLPYYYSSSDVFFCFSRYEGGAPILTLSEAMASGCLVVCSKDSEQEIIKDQKNGIIIEKYNKETALKILKNIEYIKKFIKIKKNSLKTLQKLSLDNWVNQYNKIF
jgi:glycosyltransferase involved in cell wall biosynthesis